MDDMRSRSFRDGMMQLDVYGDRLAAAPPPVLHDFRSHSASYTYSYKGGGGYGLDDFNSKPACGSSSSSNKGSDRWSFSDPDFQRKRRVAGYKAYSVESKVKGSIRRSFQWLNDRYFLIVYDG